MEIENPYHYFQNASLQMVENLNENQQRNDQEPLTKWELHIYNSVTSCMIKSETTIKVQHFTNESE